MATRKLTDKQKDKLKNSKYVRSNSDDVTVNPSFEEDIENDGTLTYDKRTIEGKEIEKILNSRNRKSSSSQMEADSDDEEDNTWEDSEYDEESEFDDYEEENEVPWEFCSPENYYDLIYGPKHDEDDESVADLYED